MTSTDRGGITLLRVMPRYSGLGGVEEASATGTEGGRGGRRLKAAESGAWLLGPTVSRRRRCK